MEQISGANFGDKTSNSVVFEVDFSAEEGNGSKKIKKPPARLSEYRKSRPSLGELEMKQQQASERRKEQEAARIARVIERQEECHRLNAKISRLLEVDAKRQGQPGTEKVKSMSKKELNRTLHGVAMDITKMTGNISKLE